jgi:signal transduction histidine kinase
MQKNVSARRDRHGVAAWLSPHLPRTRPSDRGHGAAGASHSVTEGVVVRQASAANLNAALGIRQLSERAVAFRVTLAFVLFAVTWGLVTDLLIYAFTPDALAVARLETGKEWLFVALAAIAVYLLTRLGASKLARARRTIAAIVESIADGVLLIGPDRTIVHANPAALELLHATGPRDVVGMDAIEFARRFRVTRPDGTAMVAESFLAPRAFEASGVLRHRVQLHLAGEEAVTVLSTVAPVKHSVDSIADLVVTVLHDVSQMERLEHMRDEFLSVAAHSLKTPVGILKGSAQLLHHRTGPQAAKPLSAIDRQCARLQRMTDNLVVLARLRAGSLPLYPVEVDLGRLVQHVTAETARLRPGLKLRAEVVLGLTAVADPERMAVAIQNMLDEALRSANPQAMVVTLAHRAGAELEIGVRYELRAPDEPPIYPYERYDDLGLRRYVTQAVVEAHRGVVRHESSGRLRSTWLLLPT